MIVVWSVVCAAGLAIFLFQILGPGFQDEGAGPPDVAVTVGFWVLVWFAPVLWLFLKGRGHSGEPER